MRTKGRKGVMIVALALVICILVPTFATSQVKAQLYIPVISKGFQHQFWQAVKLGAERAAKQYNVQITFEGPPTEADIQPQVQMLVNAMAKSPAAICLAALDTSSVMDQLNEAIQRKIPIIGFDSGVPKAPKGSIYATAATNSYNAAGLAADKMFDKIKDKIIAATASSPITIVDFNQDATSQSVTDRGKGFRDEMIKLISTQGKHPLTDIRVQGNPAYIASSTPTKGKAVVIDVVVPPSPRDTDMTNAAQAILNRFQSDNIVGIFCSNEGAARGVLSATNDGSALPDQYPDLLVVGFDAGKAQKAAVKAGYFMGAITQDPVQIGFKAVELAVFAIQKKPVKDVDTGAKFYDASTMDQPEFGPLLYD
ncbi:MAG: ABC transporter substrate-binding protein [Rectinemataceae bacterium]|jgi:ribose transport system substrate-binding protein